MIYNKITFIRVPELIPVTSNALTTPPIGLAYLAGFVRAKGYDVKIIDTLGEGMLKYSSWEPCKNLLLHGLPIEEIVAKIDPLFSKTICISNMFSQDWPHTRTLIKKIKEKYPESIIIIGGEHITAATEFSLKECRDINFAVRGEGEETCISLLDALNSVCTMKEVEGIGFINKQGEYVQTKSRKRITAIDDLPYPAWDLVPLENYLSTGSGMGVNKGRNMPIIATRGCPFACTFCSNPSMWTQRWAARDPQKVVDEMEYLIKKYHVNNFDFYDLTAIIKKEWILEFCKELEKRRLQVTWQLPSGTRSEAIDEEVTFWMNKTGCSNIVYAPESGSERTLKRIQKKVHLPHLLKSMKAAVKTGMFVKMNIVLGFPDDTIKDIFETYMFLMKCAWIGVHDVFIYSFTPYTGSVLFDHLKKEGIIKEINDEYFYQLSTYTKINDAISYTKYLTSRQLKYFKLVGMMWFYMFALGFHPHYIVKCLKNLKSGKAETRLDGIIKTLVRLLTNTFGVLFYLET